MPNPNTTSTSPSAAPDHGADQELALIRIVLSARGWECVDARQDGPWLRLAARKHYPVQPLSLKTVDDER